MGRKITKSKAKKNSRKNSKKKDKKKKKSSSVKNSAQVNSRKLPEPLSRMPTNEMALTPRFEASGTPETVARSPSPIGQSEITGEPPQLVPMPSSPDLPNIVDPVNISTQFRAGSSEGENPMSNQNDDLLAISRQDADLTHTESAPIDTAEIFKSFKAQHPLFKPTDFVGITFDLFLVALGTAFVTSSFSTHLNQSVHNDFLSGVPDAFEVMTVYGLASELSHQKDQSSQKISRPIEKTLWQKTKLALTISALIPLSTQLVLKSGHDILSLITHSKVVATAAVGVFAFLFAARDFVESAQAFRESFRHQSKASPEALLKDRLEKISAIDKRIAEINTELALPGVSSEIKKNLQVEQQKLLENKDKLITQAVSLYAAVEKIIQGLETNTQETNAQTQNYNANFIKKTALKNLLENKVPNEIKSHKNFTARENYLKLAEFLVKNQKTKAKASLKKAVTSFFSGAGALFMGLSLFFPPLALGTAVCFGILGLIKAYDLVSGIYQKKSIHTTFMAIAKVLLTQSDSHHHGALHRTMTEISSLEQAILAKKKQLKSPNTLSLNKNKNQIKKEIAGLEEKLKAAHGNLKQMISEAIVREKLGLNREDKIEDYISHADMNNIVTDYCAEHQKSAKAYLALEGDPETYKTNQALTLNKDKKQLKHNLSLAKSFKDQVLSLKTHETAFMLKEAQNSQNSQSQHHEAHLLYSEGTVQGNPQNTNQNLMTPPEAPHAITNSENQLSNRDPSSLELND